MVSACAVANCKNSKGKCKNRDDISFHKFPRNVSLCAEWVSRCCRKDKINTKTAIVCSDHFIETDYVDYMKAHILNLPKSKILKPDAIPQKNLTGKFSTPTSRNDRPKRKAFQNAVQQIEVSKELLSFDDAVPSPIFQPIVVEESPSPVQKQSVQQPTVVEDSPPCLVVSKPPNDKYNNEIKLHNLKMKVIMAKMAFCSRKMDRLGQEKTQFLRKLREF